MFQDVLAVCAVLLATPTRIEERLTSSSVAKNRPETLSYRICGSLTKLPPVPQNLESGVLEIFVPVLVQISTWRFTISTIWLGPAATCTSGGAQLQLLLLALIPFQPRTVFGGEGASGTIDDAEAGPVPAKPPARGEVHAVASPVGAGLPPLGPPVSGTVGSLGLGPWEVPGADWMRTAGFETSGAHAGSRAARATVATATVRANWTSRRRGDRKAVREGTSKRGPR